MGIELARLYKIKDGRKETIPWTRVSKKRYKSSREEVVRHELYPITRDHVSKRPDEGGVGYVPSLGYLNKSDVGRRLILDVPVDDAREPTAWVVD